MVIDILTIFPGMFDGFLNHSIIKRAIQNQILTVNIIDFRSFSTNKHHTVDDYAYGGGAGMLIGVEPIHLALQSINNYQSAYKILTSPSGVTFNQEIANQLSQKDHLIIVCGHYEGIDARVLNYLDQEISVGDYVLTGGEIPTMVIIDSVARLIPDVISNQSPLDESFMTGLLEYPQYTRPYSYQNYQVPDILISGHHANINKWRKYQALKKTYLNRPDLLEKYPKTKEDHQMLEEIINELKKDH